MSVKQPQFADSLSVSPVQSRCQHVYVDVYQTAAVCRRSVSIACTQSGVSRWVKFDVYQTAAVCRRSVSIAYEQSRCQQVKFDVYQTAAVWRQSVSIACTQSVVSR